MPNRMPVSREWLMLLDCQSNMVSAAQTRAHGVSPDAVRWQLKAGRWRKVHTGVYATFTGTLSREAQLWAAILRLGPTAVLSHETAAEVQGFASQVSDRIHVTVPVDSHPARWKGLRGVIVHRSVHWQADPNQPTWNLPRTPVVTTVLDLVAAADTLDDAYGWLSRAITNRATTTTVLEPALSARKKYARRSWLMDALTDVGDGVHFPLERRWVRDVEQAHGLPSSTHQVMRKGADGIRYLDNYYEAYRLCVELDGVTFHPPDELARDRRRDNETRIASHTETFRFGFPEVANRPCEQAEQFARALADRGWEAETLRPCKPACPVSGLHRQLHRHTSR